MTFMDYYIFNSTSYRSIFCTQLNHVYICVSWLEIKIRNETKNDFQN